MLQKCSVGVCTLNLPPQWEVYRPEEAASVPPVAEEEEEEEREGG